ncbi:hypothetical protein JCM3766R1_000094 [Sporobolomyces carnicolor]
MYLYGILRLAVLFHIVVASPLALDLNVDPDRQLSFNDVSEASTVANVDRVPRPDKVPYYDPRDRGGSLLNRNPWGGGEPLNVIISAQSSPDVLRKNGLIAFSRSLGLWNECANLHIGDPQEANLGDGKGWEAERLVMRESWWPIVGSCLESAIGGNHFRAYKQNGTEANSGAWFLAASKEVDLRGKHKIAPNGYNVGRDLIVQRAVAGSRYLGRTWQTSVVYVEGLLEPGNEGINHGIEQDGKVAVLTVKED